MANVLARLDNKEYVIPEADKTLWKNKGYDIYSLDGSTKLEEDNRLTMTYNEHLTAQAAAVKVVQDDYDAYKLVNAATALSVAAIAGVTAPVKGATPVTAATANAERTGVVSWSPAIPEDGKFAADTAYTATITLTPKTGYTVTGVTQDLFTVAGASAVTNPADSGVCTAVFPKTAA